MKLKIACLQLAIKNTEKETFKEVEELIKKTNAKIIVLPETFHCLFSYEKDKFGQTLDGSVVKFLKDKAKKYKKYIVAGIVKKNKTGILNNSALVINDNGRLIAVYDKMHLIKAMKEHLFYKRGNKFVTFDINGVKCGIAICYEVRFPYIFRELTKRGAKIIFVISNWPTVRQAHWDILLKARAIENQLYIVAVNISGKKLKYVYDGGTYIIDPKGNYVARSKTKKQEIVEGAVDTDDLDKWRNDFPVLRDFSR